MSRVRSRDTKPEMIVRKLVYGLGYRYRVQDLWLACQAIQYGYRFLTRNSKDFEDIPGLDLVIIQG